MGQFKPMDKMETTEPSVMLKLKKGGQAKRQHMADGGVPMTPPPAMLQQAQGQGRPMPSRGGPSQAALNNGPRMGGRRPMPIPSRASAAAVPEQLAPKMKKGGKAEGGKADMAQDKAMIKKAFKQHDMQEHKGAKGTNLKLKGGGVADAGADTPGGLLGGIEVTRSVAGKTSGVRSPGYKKGGAINVNDKVVGAKQTKSLNTKTAGVEGRGFKKGGTVSASVANQYKNTKVHDGESMPTKKGATKSIHQVPAGHKAGGHIMHSAMSAGGSCGHMPMKKGGRC